MTGTNILFAQKLKNLKFQFIEDVASVEIIQNIDITTLMGERFYKSAKKYSQSLFKFYNFDG